MRILAFHYRLAPESKFPRTQHKISIKKRARYGKIKRISYSIVKKDKFPFKGTKYIVPLHRISEMEVRCNFYLLTCESFVWLVRTSNGRSQAKPNTNFAQHEKSYWFATCRVETTLCCYLCNTWNKRSCIAYYICMLHIKNKIRVSGYGRYKYAHVL